MSGMDEPDLSFINVDIDLDEVKPLGTKKIAAFVNYFLIKNVQVLNRFVHEMEEKIVDIERRMSRVEVELKLLELKLDSVPGLRAILSNESELPEQNSFERPVLASSIDTLKEETNKDAEVSVINSLLVPRPSNVNSVERLQESETLKRAPTEPPSHCLRNRDDPRYAIYFRMLRMGVPENGVKQKMTAEGVDASILDVPDAPSDLPHKDIAAVTAESRGSLSADDEQDSASSSFSDT